VAGNANQVPTSTPVTNTSGNLADSLGITNTTGLSAAALAAARSSLATNSAAALTSTETELLQSEQTTYLANLSTSSCATCKAPPNTSGIVDQYYPLSDLKGVSLATLGPLGTATFIYNARNAGSADVLTLSQTLTVNYAAANLTNNYSFTQTVGSRPVYQAAGNFSSPFSRLTLAGADSHLFVLPTDPTQTNLQMTAALAGSTTQTGYSAGKIASLGYVINLPAPYSRTVTGLARVGSQ
jgi:hypothetical protein